MDRPAVVYLLRAKNGLAPAQRFFQSYRAMPAGMDHELVVVFKGFSKDSEIEPYLRLFQNEIHRTLSISDFGFDLRAYRLAAEQLSAKHICFLNSFSEILSPGWLEKLHHAMIQTDVALVGATGSCESMHTNAVADLSSTASPLNRLWRKAHAVACQRLFFPFPNYHIRTNGFMMERQLMLKLWPRVILTKRRAYLFESGRQSLTQKIIKRGLKPLIVGLDGQIFEKEFWSRSGTFRQGSQENLLIADNQTRAFAEADVALKTRLAAKAWGNFALVDGERK